MFILISFVVIADIFTSVYNDMLARVQNRILQAKISDHIPQKAVICNYSSMPMGAPTQACPFQVVRGTYCEIQMYDMLSP